MSSPSVVTHEGPAELAGSVADALLARLAELQADGVVPQVGLTGGSIADELHRALAARSAASAVDWSRVEVWWGDERFVPADSPDRNAGQARAALLDHVPVDPARVHEVPASDQAADVHAAAAAYSTTVRAHGAGGFDVLLLGIGPDGHVASLFPGHPGLEVDDQIATGVRESPKPPSERVTLTLGALAHAAAVWFIAAGADKGPAVAAALAVGSREASPDEVRELPARGVRGRQETVWHLDRALADAMS
jgi:6-phosphogluconolactonase